MLALLKPANGGHLRYCKPEIHSHRNDLESAHIPAEHEAVPKTSTLFPSTSSSTTHPEYHHAPDADFGAAWRLPPARACRHIDEPVLSSIKTGNCRVHRN